MIRTISIDELSLSGDVDRKGNPIFSAAGMIIDTTFGGTTQKSFTAKTIQHKGEPIFKIQESGDHQRLEDSEFDRGERIAVARACKKKRFELFGTGQKSKIKPDLAPGEIVELFSEADEICDEDLEAASEILSGVKNEKHNECYDWNLRSHS